MRIEILSECVSEKVVEQHNSKRLEYYKISLGRSIACLLFSYTARPRRFGGKTFELTKRQLRHKRIGQDSSSHQISFIVLDDISFAPCGVSSSSCIICARQYLVFENELSYLTAWNKKRWKCMKSTTNTDVFYVLTYQRELIRLFL